MRYLLPRASRNLRLISYIKVDVKVLYKVLTFRRLLFLPAHIHDVLSKVNLSTTVREFMISQQELMAALYG